ncbi:NAD(P)-binding protein [Corynespora cassiicola Philippines]|uniref:NAD(P)-binding protein n=1 Tax=Corynespora cassiicola Philippines TaxID=1448308 RepID=A0A2T2NXQ5_CORCC|nr:NAD(P)-binding protein [Corynespora cassiicola Philippines]
MPTIVITGASSGLGLAFLSHHAHQCPETTVLALDTTPLPQQASSLPNVRFHRVDITDEPALASISATVSDRISLLIHCAGIRGLVPDVVKQRGGDVAVAETWEVMTRETMARTFEVNTWGSFNVIKTFLPQLRQAGAGGLAKVVVLSSRMGSVSSNTSGGSYAYRTSKAALNAVVKSFSIDVPEVVFLLLHPGRVETGLVEWKEEGAMSVQESLVDCLKVIDSAEKKDSGTLLDRFGEVIEW